MQKTSKGLQTGPDLSGIEGVDIGAKTKPKNSLAWLCVLIIASATAASAGTMLHPTPEARIAPVKIVQQQTTGSSTDWWLDHACGFLWGLPRWCPKPVEVVEPPWCMNTLHHHTIPVRVGHPVVGVVVDDGVPF